MDYQQSAGAAYFASPSTQDAKKDVYVMGANISVDLEKIKSWQALKKVALIDSSDGIQQIVYAMDFVEYVTGKDEAFILNLLDGPDTEAAKVVSFVQELIYSLYPKNN